MAMEIGTASNPADLLFKLEKFLTTNPQLKSKGWQWQSMKDNIVNEYSDEYSLVEIKGKHHLHRFFIGGGVDGTDRIVVPMNLFVNKTINAYSLCAYSARTYDKTLGVSMQTGSTQTFCINLWNDKIAYWFFANGRRFMIVVKVGNRYMSMYCGLLLPSGLDREYVYPYYIGACNNEKQRTYQHLSNTNNGSFWKPTAESTSSQYTSGMILSPEGNVVYCGSSDMYAPYSHNIRNFAYVYPYEYNRRNMKTAGGQYVLKPIEFVQTRINEQHLGWLDGAYYVSGISTPPENIITVGDDRFICFPAMVRTDYNDWCAIKME